jgi:hypothetical protein
MVQNFKFKTIQTFSCCFTLRKVSSRIGCRLCMVEYASDVKFLYLNKHVLPLKTENEGEILFFFLTPIITDFIQYISGYIFSSESQVPLKYPCAILF